MDPTTSTTDTLPPGSRLQHYRIERLLGRGGFGVIYLAVDISLGHKVAIKEYLPSEIAGRTNDSRITPTQADHQQLYQWGLDRFVKEARNLVRFRHPNIVRVSALFQENNTAYMVMDFEEGQSLRDYARDRSLCTEALLKILIKPIAQGLSEVHRQGFIHRDIKPSNLLVRQDGSPVLLDFGSARLASRHATHGLTALVSSGYAPLEQYNPESEEQQGPWSDIYALGGVLYYCVTHKDPADSTQRSLAIVNGQPDPLVAASVVAKGQYSDPFLSAIDWALSVRIADRPQMLSDWIPALFARDVPPDASVTTQKLLNEQTRIAPASIDSLHKQNNAQTHSASLKQNLAARHDTSPNQNLTSQHSTTAKPNSAPTRTASPKQSGALNHNTSTSTRTSASTLRPTPTSRSTANLDETNLSDEAQWDKAVAAADQAAQQDQIEEGSGLTHPVAASVPTRWKFANVFSVIALAGFAIAGWLGYQQLNARLESQQAAVEAQRQQADEMLARAEIARQEAIATITEQREMDAERFRVGAERLLAEREAEREAELQAEREAEREAELQAEREAKLQAEREAKSQSEAEQARIEEAAKLAAIEREAQAQRENALADEAAQQAREAETKRLANEKAAQEARARRLAAQQAERDTRERERALEQTRQRQDALLDQALESITANDLVSAKNFLTQARSLPVSNNRVQQLASSLSAAQDNARTPISDEEFERIVGQFHQLKEAIERGNIDRIKALADGAEELALFTRLIERFDRLDISITSIRARDADKSIVGMLRIDRMIRNNGNRATPSSSYQERTLTSQRIGGEWGKITW